MLKRVKQLWMLLVICVLALTSGGITVFADYPIFYQRYTADPSALEANGRLYIYASHDVYDPNNPGYIMNDITCISTDDLKNWTDHGEVFKASGWAKYSWAPVVVENNNKYYMYFGNNASAIGVAVSDSPEGPFKDPLGKALITGSSPGVNPPSGFWCFDPGAFVDDDGKAYIYFGGGSVDDNTRVMQLGSDMISTVGSAVKINAPSMFEDSWIHKYNGKYYYSYCTRPATGTKIDYMVSDNPMTGFVHKGTILDGPPENEGNNNHHSTVQYNGNWYIAYHNRALAIANGAPSGDARTFQRNVALDSIGYNTDGTMKKATFTKDGLIQLKSVNPYVTNEGETMAQCSGIQTEACSEGGRNVCNIENGDWIKIRGVDFGSGATSFEARVASATSGGNIELRLDSPTGTLVGTCAVQGTGGWQTWTAKSCTVSGATGKHDLYLKFTGGSGSLFNLNSWKFSGAGVTPELRSAFSQIEAEDFNTQSGVQAETCTEGGQDVGYIENGDYTVYENVDFGAGASGFQARVATSTQGGNIEVRLDSIDGPLVGTCSVGTTGGFQSWTDVSCKISGASGKHNVYLKFTGGSGYLFNINWFQFMQSAFARIEAEGYSSLSSSSIQIADTPDEGKSLAYVENGNYAMYGKVDFGSGADLFKAKVATTGTTSIEVRLGSPTGTLIGTLPVASTGGWNVYQEQSCAIEKVTGVKDVYLVFKGSVNFDCFSFAEEVKPNPVKLGDLNSDGDINSVDFLLMKKHILELETLADSECADLDGNGAVNTVDMLLLKQYLLGIITEFPV